MLGSDDNECTAGPSHQRLSSRTAYPGGVRLRARVEDPEGPSPPRDTGTTPAALIVLLVLAYGAGLFAATTAIRASEAAHSPLPLPLTSKLRRIPAVRTPGR